MEFQRSEVTGDHLEAIELYLMRSLVYSERLAVAISLREVIEVLEQVM